MTRPVPLIRRFTEIAEHYQDYDARLEQVWPHLGGEERADWAELDALFRVVVLADPGAGKTFELKAQAQRLADAGKAAFFIRIEDIDDTFGAAFEVGDVPRFERWLNGAEEAWFFLDSVDEVRLETPRAFETAMRAFANRIHAAAQRAHVVVSSRPYAWKFSFDNALLREVLPYASDEDAPDLSDESGENWSPTGLSNMATARRKSPLKIFRLTELDDDDIRIFAGYRGVDDANALLAALERAALMDLARVPFDLEDLIETWEEAKSFDGRLRVLERGLERRLTPSSRDTAKALPIDRALSGARRLALAVTLLGEANLRMPRGQGGGLDAAALLADWTAEDVEALLNRGVFSDPIYAAVRFRHREIRELLAAQQLSEMLKTPEGRAEVEALIFRTIYGVTVIPPRLRPLLPWLILYDQSIQDRALALAPELVTEGGDAAQLPFEARRAILRDIVRRIVEDKERGGDNSQLARIAHEDLSGEAAALIAAHSDHADAIFFLGRLVWQGSMRTAAEALAPIARDSSRDSYARLVSVRAVMTVLGPEAGDALWDELLGSGEILSRDLLSEFINNAAPTSGSVRRLLASLGQVRPHARFSATGLSYAIHGFIRRLPMMGERAAEKPIVDLVEGLAEFLTREPFIERRECEISEAFQWLMSPALHAIERLVAGRASACLEAPVLGIIGQIPALRDYGNSEDGDHQAKLGELIPRWAALNDALFWHTVAMARSLGGPGGRVVNDDWAVEWMRHLWAFDAASFSRSVKWIRGRELGDDRLVALTRSFRTYQQNGRPRAWRDALWRAVRGDPALETRLRGLMRPGPSPTRRNQRAQTRRWAVQSRRQKAVQEANRASWVARIKSNPELVRTPAFAPGIMSQDQAVVLQSLPSNGSSLGRGAATSWRAIVPEFGEAVADAFADGARRHWRAYRPELRSEGADDTNLPYPLIFGMVGLDIEAGVDGTGLAGLSEDEARNAMRYAPRELNGFPTWFELLYRAHPAAGLALVWQEASWELARAPTNPPLHYILGTLANRAPWLHGDLAPLVLDWLSTHGAATDEALRYGRAIMLSGGGAPGAIAKLARGRIADDATPADQLPAWFALWTDSDPGAAIPVLTEHLAALPQPDDAEFAARFVVALVGGRHNAAGPAIGAWREPRHLKSLYLLMHLHVRIAEDIDRANGGAYSPELRDDAQDARDALFARLAEIPGQASYNEILQLAAEHPAPRYRVWMRRRAHDRAVEDSERQFAFDEVAALISVARGL